MAIFEEGHGPAAGTNKDAKHLPVNLAVLRPGTLAPVDIYVRTGGRAGYVLYKRAGAELTEQIRKRLLDNGVHQLFIRKSDREHYDDYIEQNLSAIIRDDLMPLEEACTLVHESTCRIMRDIFENPRDGKNLRRAHTVSEAMVRAVLKSPDALWHLTALASHNYAAHVHSVNVALFLTAAARELLGEKHLRQLKRIALGGLLHDVGKSQIPNDILDKPSELTYQEFQLVRQHPTIGLELVNAVTRVSSTTATIIRSHHENVAGDGYPDGLTWENIPPIARLARIVDAFDAMTSDRSYGRARAPFRVLKEMLDTDGEFDIALLRCFVGFLGPRKPCAQTA